MARAAGLDEAPTGRWPDWTDARVKAAVALAGDAAPFAQQGLAALDTPVLAIGGTADRSEEHTSELQSLMRRSYAVFCLKKKQHKHKHTHSAIPRTRNDE